jgi:cytochrome c
MFPIAAICALLIGLSAQDEPVGDIKAGRALAIDRCSACHAVDVGDASAQPAAPPFRDLNDRYDVEGLAESLAEGIFVGNPIMPEHVLEAAEILDLIAYLRSFEPKGD